MCIDEKFIKVVAQGNSLEIRTYLASHLLLDSKFNDFDEALSYANSKINVLQDDDNKEYEYDSRRRLCPERIYSQRHPLRHP